MENPLENGGPNKLEQTQAQVNEVVRIMHVNVEKVLERDQKLPELNDRVEALEEASKTWEQQTKKLKKKYWWKNVKMIVILCVVGLVILLITIVSITISVGGDDTTERPLETSEAP